MEKKLTLNDSTKKLNSLKNTKEKTEDAKKPDKKPSKKTYVAIGVALVAFFSACAKDGSKKLVCNPAIKGAWLYDDSKNLIQICIPGEKGLYGWQEAKWIEKTPQQAPTAQAPEAPKAP